MTSRLQSSGLSSPLKPPPLGSTSSGRRMVLASKPVASIIRLAGYTLLRKNAQDHLDNRGLANIRTAVHDQQLDRPTPDRAAPVRGGRSDRVARTASRSDGRSQIIAMSSDKHAAPALSADNSRSVKADDCGSSAPKRRSIWPAETR